MGVFDVDHDRGDVSDRSVRDLVPEGLGPSEDHVRKVVEPA